MDNLAIANKIRSARTRAGLSQSQLGAHIGVSDKAISAYEAGRSVPPVNKLSKIAQYTNHTLTYFTNEGSAPKEEAMARLKKIEQELEDIKRLLTK